MLPFLNARQDRDQIVFQQDGARAHTAREVTTWLENNIPNVCSMACQQDVRNGRFPFLFGWPPYSPDLSPMDFGSYFIDINLI